MNLPAPLSRSRKVSGPREDHDQLPILSEELFHQVLQIEQKRTERSRRRFVLMRIECANLMASGSSSHWIQAVLESLSRSVRVTDITGWYRRGSTIGIIFTEIGTADGKAITCALLNKITTAFAETLSIEQINQIQISFEVYPEDWDGDGGGSSTRETLPIDTIHAGTPKKGAARVKRLIDIIGSLFALTLLWPVFLAIAVLVKWTSKGPVLFRQRRVGQFGRPFVFLKFRSMVVDNDPSIHEEFVAKLIRNKEGGRQNGNGGGAQEAPFKLTHDPRITPLGGFLRRTSLDELPQFLNVLKGDMSLVGPRPPIPYEVKNYEVWHRRRLLEVKPGITGLWQVYGRSRVAFDDMVRMDLKYASTWSLWLDLKILLQTPRAVLGTQGAR